MISGEDPRVVLPEDEGYAEASEDVSAVDPRIWFAWVEEYEQLVAQGWGADAAS